MNKWIGFMGVALFAGSVLAQDDAAPESSVQWVEGPSVGELSTISKLGIPEGYIFTGPEGTKEVMASMGNLITETEIGMIASESNSWIAVFEFDPCGFVKDDDKDELDAGALMKSLKESQEASNERRRQMQMGELFIDGWYREPFYNEATQNLEWCTQLRSSDSDEPFVNHNIRILGRYGVTRIVLVADIEELDTAIPELEEILKSYEYLQGQKYAEFTKGDKVAKYGLTALVAGGAAAVALKSGLLQKMFKPLIIGLAAAVGFFKKIFRKKK